MALQDEAAAKEKAEQAARDSGVDVGVGVGEGASETEVAAVKISQVQEELRGLAQQLHDLFSLHQQVEKKAEAEVGGVRWVRVRLNARTRAHTHKYTRTPPYARAHTHTPPPPSPLECGGPLPAAP